MTDIFISYARSTAPQAQAIAEALRGLGYGDWRDDELPAHRPYAEVIEERLQAAKAVVVVWSAEAAKSEWVQSEADRARLEHKVVQLRVDSAALPMPFDRIQCADLKDWTGDTEAPGWRKLAASVAELAGPGSSHGVAATAQVLPLPRKPSIVVMPFANLSGDPEQEYFADGMLVEIVEALSRFRSIFVIASGTSLLLKGKGVDAQQAAGQLGVRYVLEGSVRKSGSRVRIGVQLIEAADGAPIWTERFEDTIQDIFDLQDRVALAVAGRIEPTVQAAEIRRVASRGADSLDSYDLYLRALPLFRTLSPGGMFQALELLQRAVALDPGNAPALAAAANCHYLIEVYGWSDDPAGHAEKAVTLARQAQAAGGDDAEVLANAGVVLAGPQGDPEMGRALLERALSLNPGSSLALFLNGMTNLDAGRLEPAISQVEAALRLDPAGPLRTTLNGALGRGLFALGRFGEALPRLREAAQASDFPVFWAYLAACLGHLGRLSEAQAALARHKALTPLSFEELSAASLVADPVQRKLILDGIALAEQAEPAASSAPIPPPQGPHP